jgi:hypothetical protein
MKRPFMKYALLASAVAVAIAFSPAASSAEAKKKAAKMSPPAPCTANATCSTKCNEQKWCSVMWCSKGKWVETPFYCYDQFCSAKC